MEELRETVEHFPSLHTYTIVQLGGVPVLVNRRRDGALEVFEDLGFHGGDGETLEMRVFSFPDILRRLAEAGFVDIEVIDGPVTHFGLAQAGCVILARRPMEGNNA